MKFNVSLSESYFEAVSKQLLSADKAIGEPVDNAIANAGKGQNALILVSVDQVEDCPELIRFTIADWGKGMDAKALVNALQFGSAHSDEGYLCMYGVGLCNFLLVMSQNKYDWVIASKPRHCKEYNIVEGPFSVSKEMTKGKLPLKDIVMRKGLAMYGEPSTVVSVVTDKRVASTMLSTKGTAAPSKVTSLNVLRKALTEHLGVKYRGFLEMDEVTRTAPARIMLTDYVHENGKREDVFIRAVRPPYLENHHYETTVVIEGHEVPVQIEYGRLDKERLGKMVMGEHKPSYYYAYSMDTQGFDIQLGRRTVATAQMSSIWGVKPHPQFNAWTGCVKVGVEEAKLPRGFLNTLANKSDIDVSDLGWQKIFDVIRNHPDIKPRGTTCSTIDDYRNMKARALEIVHPNHEVETQHAVYSSRVKVDIMDVAPDGTCAVYCICKGKASILALDKLKLFWNGVVAEGLQPTVGYLVCKESGPMVKIVCESWNKMIQETEASCTIPVNEIPTYHFEIVEDQNIPD